MWLLSSQRQHHTHLAHNHSFTIVNRECCEVDLSLVFKIIKCEVKYCDFIHFLKRILSILQIIGCCLYAYGCRSSLQKRSPLVSFGINYLLGETS